MRPRATRLMALDEAVRRLAALVSGPVAPRLVAPAEALGRTLAEAVTARTALPPRPLAARDGWAVLATETEGAGAYAPAPLAQPPLLVAPGTPMPPGRDAVLALFDLDADGPLPQALQPVAQGEGVLPAGEDWPAGSVLRAAGEVLRPFDLPALAALGVTGVAVRVPRVAWLPVGDAIVADPAQETLGAMFAVLVAAAGGALTRLESVPDAPSAIAVALRSAAAAHDLVLTAGGTGEGTTDQTARGLADAGRVLVHGIGLCPGTTSGFGAVDGVPVVMLPGSVGDALAAWLVLAAPVLALLAGRAEAPPSRARLVGKIASVVGIAELVALRPEADGRVVAVTVGALPLHALGTGLFALIPAASEGAEDGALLPLLTPSPAP
jgi:molybdenum cofactor synthesis domain-containing protein